MKPAKHSNKIVIILFCCGIVSVLFGVNSVSSEVKYRYTREECVTCHTAQANDIATDGRRHRNVPCVGCHEGHPPEVKRPIASCNKCHLKKKRAHFTIGGCLGCHTNPHTPLKIPLRSKEDCVLCHAAKVEQMQQSKIKHSLFDCTMCHDVHRKIPECTQCHRPHLKNDQVKCRQCHMAHMPRYVPYPDDIPSKYCSSCHQKPADFLDVNTTKHGLLSCTNCHYEKHKAIPVCQGCHGSPHPAGIMRKFPKCVNCHNSPHALNDWNLSEAQNVPSPARGKGATKRPAH